MRKKSYKPILFILLFLATALWFQLPATAPVKAQGGGSGYHEGDITYQWDPALYSSTWPYRIRVSVTEPDVADRINEPIDVYLEFPSSMRRKSIHVKYYENENDTWYLVPYQVWETDTFLSSCTVTFLANLSKGSTSHYYVYFSNVSSATAEDSPEYITWNNDTGFIDAFNYQAGMNLDYGFLDDFIIDGKDLIGEDYTWQYPWPGGSVEAGIITDGQQPWRDEIDGNEDTAALDNSLSIIGPVFTRLVINKTTDEWPDGSDINRVWTFYPNYFTLEVSYDRVDNGQARLVIYGRSYHNGGYGGPIGGAWAVENYTRYGTEYVRDAYIDGSGGDEYMQDYNVPTPRWFGVYENGQYAYSCVPTQDSDINAIHYYDRASYYQNPRMYGTIGWGYYVQYGVLPLGLEAKLFYFPHGPQPSYSNYDFAINDHARVNNPVTDTNGSIEYRIFNLLTVEAVDYDGNYISSLTVQLSNATPERNETTEGGIAEFNDLESGVYDINFWYNIGSTEYQVSANFTALDFNPGYERLSTAIANCSLRTLHMYLQDEDYGLPLYDYTLRLNSTTNSIDINGTTDENGNHNFTLLTYQSDFYNISVYDPDDIEQTAEPTGVNLNSSALGVPPTLILTLIPPLNVTTLSHEYSNSSIDYASTIHSWRFITPTYAEVYYGDNVTFSISFIDVDNGNASIGDANQSSWELYLVGDLWDWGNAIYNSTAGMYTISLNTSDYQWNTEYTLKIHFEREGCLIPANKTIVIVIKSWNTTFTSVPEIDTMSIYYFDRVSLTIFLNYIDALSTPQHFLVDPENFTASILGVGPLTIANSSFTPQGNNITFDFNLSGLVDLGSYVLMINANHTYYDCKQLSITLNLIPQPTYATWNSSEDFELLDGGSPMLRAAVGENLTVELWARSNATASFPGGNVTDETGTYLLPWEDPIDFVETGSPGVYSFNVSTSNCPEPENYTVTVLIFKQYFESIQVSIPLDVREYWSASLEFISIEPTSAEVFWGENVTVTLNYSCYLEPREGQIENANITFDWISGYWSYESPAPGIYEIELNTSAKEPKGYSTVASANKTFYQYVQISSPQVPTITAYELGTSISLLNWTASVEPGEDDLLRVELMDVYGVPILDANITYLIEGTALSGKLNLVGTTYEATISTQDLETGDYWINLTVDLPGRTVGDDTFEVYAPTGSVRFKFAVGTPFPLILTLALFMIGITAVPAGYGALRYYRWARLPSTVKKIVRTISSIKKNKQVKEEIIATREALVSDSKSKFFASAGISMPEAELAPSPGKAELIPEIAKLREVVYDKFPSLPESEKEALVSELSGMEPSERDQFIRTLVGARAEQQALIKKELAKEVLTEEEIEDALEELLQKQIISAEEKLILTEELKSLPPEERREFLEKLRKS